MRHLLLLLSLFALAGCQAPQDGVKVTVTATGFVPGCLRVTARDEASGETRSTMLGGKGTPSVGGSVLVGVVLPESWGTRLTLTAEAHEAPFVADQGCTGKVITSKEGAVSIVRGEAAKGRPPELTLALTATDQDGDGYVHEASGGTDCNDTPGIGDAIHPGALERCNGRDDDCNGDDDQTFFGLGVACAEDGGCSGRLECDLDNLKTTCKAPAPTLAWVDKDGDQVGRANVEPSRFCAPLTVPDAGYVPFTARHDDCDDTNRNIHPAALEACNGLDDNCDGSQDNIAFEACTTLTSQCSGAQQCKGTSGEKECVATGPVPTWYPDQDLDGRGVSGMGTPSCTLQADAGYALHDGDCDDGNPFIHSAATELCDEQDNDCDGEKDEAQVCGATVPGWEARLVGGNTARIWHGISLYQNGGVWLAGTHSGRGAKLPDKVDFTFPEGTCAGTPPALYSVWAHPRTAKAFLGGADENLSIQEATSITCGPQPSIDSDNPQTVIHGLMGFADSVDPEEVQIFGVATSGNGNDGATFLWNGQTASVPVLPATDTTLRGVHGLSPALMFAVGSYRSPSASAQGRILRYQPGEFPSWGQHVEPPDAKALNAVWVVHPRLAYAVGYLGTFMKWDGATWSKQAGPSDSEQLTGVVAFGSNAIYVSSESGTLYRYYDGVWHTHQLGAPLHALNGNRPDNIWAAGAQGKVFHYPAWSFPTPP
ncbi:MAG: hypothetical protein EOO72_02620 [Myxococcaceae bacterium]|nr:MAG: hypothetical protein EOO72_02620 [Myxococcaceae bacterium]